ncbi:hypothetical protein [Desulforhabdus amnigena]|jgi:DNA integrity scanning protein DisA with diadenylate cyclase activity|uniref:Uncharacterized protein n=1 Tax=Desulforhabdus amnigena TaxID=40218 RepID=A0A9W6FWI7_9BACT|nr:hypothetical protein [Desulforhabdus amnigena]NLJ29462.1 hypothetical protein [Deltaproteobacteria bacterium]GLI36144.1 hypothetical protein DAMNIGENAA_35770 [Desulforhabdus amnigena]
MSIRMLAVELYSVMKRVKELEKKLENMAPGTPGRDEVERELNRERAEQKRLKKMLDGAKEG